MPRGGYRPGAGRKPKKVNESLTSQLKPWTPDAVRQLGEAAANGEPWAIKQLMAYVYGVPATYVPESDGPETEQPKDVRKLRVELNSNKAVNE